MFELFIRVHENNIFNNVLFEIMFNKDVSGKDILQIINHTALGYDKITVK